MADIELTPMPVERLVRQAVDDGADYDDGVGGYVGAAYDIETGVLTLRYERADGEPVNPDDDDYNHSTTEHRFQYLPAATA